MQARRSTWSTARCERVVVGKGTRVRGPCRVWLGAGVVIQKERASHLVSRPPINFVHCEVLQGDGGKRKGVWVNGPCRVWMASTSTWLQPPPPALPTPPPAHRLLPLCLIAFSRCLLLPHLHLTRPILLPSARPHPHLHLHLPYKQCVALKDVHQLDRARQHSQLHGRLAMAVAQEGVCAI